MKPRRLILVAELERLRRASPTAAEILSWSEELADTPNQLWSPERPCTRGSIQQLNPSCKEKADSLATVTKLVGGDKNVCAC